MSPLDLDIGVDLEIVDDPTPGTAPTATDTGFLLHSIAVPANPQTVQELRTAAQARDVYPGETALFAAVDTFFGVSGGGRLYVAPLGVDEGASVAAFDSNLGPGQLMAPEVVTATEIGTLRDWAWDENRIYHAQAPDGITEAALTTLSAALVSLPGRFSGLEADRLIIPGAAAGTTREVAASVVKAALNARNDRLTGNPNVAAAGGIHDASGAGGQPLYVLGVKNERPFSEVQDLARQQVNCFRTINGRVRAYGYFTLADTDQLIVEWADMGGSRTMMAARAREQAVAEELMFGQVAADGAFLDRYKGALAGELAPLQRIGAIYGTDEVPGYTVDVTSDVNPLTAVAQGKVVAEIGITTSPHANQQSIRLARRAINEQTA